MARPIRTEPGEDNVGLRDLDIASELSISTATVRKHMENVHNLLGVHSRSEAVVRALGG